MAGLVFIYPSLWKLHISDDGDEAYLTVVYQGRDLIEYYSGTYSYAGRSSILTCTLFEHTSNERYFLKLKKTGSLWKTIKEDEPIVTLKKE